MRAGVVVIVLQLVIGIALAGLALPLVMAEMPAARAGSVGPWVALTIAVIIFLVLRVVWPKARR